jgi:HD superfamily phosphohydrolase
MILRDPVHGLVSFESDEEKVVELLMDTPELQRLRRVRQLGVTALAFRARSTPASRTRWGRRS